MKKTGYWCLVLLNYEAYDDTYYFSSYEMAKKNFDVIVESHKDMDEFRQTSETTCEWFDCNYNEYSTYAKISYMPLPKIYDKIIF